MNTTTRLLFALILTSAAGLAPAQETKKYVEPPMFADDVKAGKLPPVAAPRRAVCPNRAADSACGTSAFAPCRPR